MPVRDHFREVNALNYFHGIGNKGDWLGALCLVALVVGTVLGVIQTIRPTSAAHLRWWNERQRAAGGTSTATLILVRALGLIAAAGCLALLLLIVAHVIHV